MSLINQMLKDLEQRRTEQAIAEPLAGVSASVVAKQGNPVNYVLLGAVLVLAVFSAVLLLMQGGSESSSPSVELTPPTGAVNATAKPIRVETVAPVAMRVVTTPQQAKPVEQAPVMKTPAPQTQAMVAAVEPTVETKMPQPEGPARLLDVKVRHVDERSRVMLDLDSKVEYQAQIEDHALLVSLANVSGEKFVAAMEGTMDDSISLVAQTQREGKLVLKFDLASDFNLRGMSMSPQGEGARLSIELSSVAEATEELAATDAVAKRIRPLTPAQQAQVAFQQAVTQLGRSNTEQAQASLRRALVHDPAHEQARETYAALLLNTGRVSEAEASLAEGLRLNPHSAILAKLYARIIAGHDQIAQAIQVLERAAPSLQNDPAYAAMLAALYQRQQRHAEAAQIYAQVVRLRPRMAAWWMGYALSLEALGDNEQAATTYGRALRLGGLDKQVSEYVMQRLQALGLSAAKPVSAANTLVSSHNPAEEE